MPALPILKLPILVLMKILKTIDIEEVILVSLCSRKMFHLIKNFRDKTEPLDFTVDGEDFSLGDSNIIVGTPDYSFAVFVSPMAKKYKTAESVNINGHLVPIDRAREEEHWNTYWNDEIQGIPAVYEHLSELLEFKGPPEVTVNRNTLWLLSYIEKRQGDNYHLVIGDISEEVCHFILKNYHPKVVRAWLLKDNFPIAQYLNSIESLSGLWRLSITLNDLLNMNCVELNLIGNHFTVSEMERILQHWAIGGFKRLKYLCLCVRDFNMEDVLRELNHTRMTEKREYKCNTAPRTTFSDRLISRNDGVVTSFQCDQPFGVVHFGVWPDSEGNEY
ncbi:hypothetical protein CRE_27816 [Caenorhabditis remanei]|uniref:F-box domain-containing protein n=1 Tax=Caenorhabditis remanei TaxID=31234 RepID=E3N5H9_CAERE|nr:hypothetical protein CRE_27816 [Caenorhabditis remanei]